jgi:hypothetical protein
VWGGKTTFFLTWPLTPPPPLSHPSPLSPSRRPVTAWCWWQWSPTAWDTGGLVADDWLTPRWDKINNLTTTAGTAAANGGGWWLAPWYVRAATAAAAASAAGGGGAVPAAR